MLIPIQELYPIEKVYYAASIADKFRAAHGFKVTVSLLKPSCSS